MESDWDFWHRITDQEATDIELSDQDLRRVQAISQSPAFRPTAQKLAAGDTRHAKARRILQFNKLPRESQGGQASATQSTDRITYQDIADIVGIEKKTVSNRASEWKNESSEIAEEIFDGCSYSVIQPILAEKWPQWFKDLTFAEARQMLNNRTK